jgi:hypothetical protein
MSRLPARPSVTTCVSLAKDALSLAKAEEDGRSRRAALDAFSMAPPLLESATRSDRSALASAMLITGEAFFLLSEAKRARECFELAAEVFDGVDDVANGARSRFGLGKALRDLQDPRARAVLEDACELFEEAGDDAGVCRADRLLREMALELDAPRSFHAASGVLRVHSRT